MGLGSAGGPSPQTQSRCSGSAAASGTSSSASGAAIEQPPRGASVTAAAAAPGQRLTLMRADFRHQRLLQKWWFCPCHLSRHRNGSSLAAMPSLADPAQVARKLVVFGVGSITKLPPMTAGRQTRGGHAGRQAGGRAGRRGRQRAD